MKFRVVVAIIDLTTIAAAWYLAALTGLGSVLWLFSAMASALVGCWLTVRFGRVSWRLASVASAFTLFIVGGLLGTAAPLAFGAQTALALAVMELLLACVLFSLPEGERSE